MKTWKAAAVSSLFDFSGKTVLITGAGGAVGSGITERFAEAGADVCIHYNSSRSSAQNVEERAGGFGVKTLCLQADLTDSSSVQDMVSEVCAYFGGIDILINNAGIYPLDNLVEMTDNQWDRVIDTDLRSVFLCTREAAQMMKEKGGVIINIASIEGENPAPAHSHYCTAKAGVVMFTRSSAKELAQYGIRVNAVSPGLIWYEGLDQSWPDGVSRYTAAAPLGRIGRASDVADACLFLSSPGASWITGINLRVDGGIGTATGY